MAPPSAGRRRRGSWGWWVTACWFRMRRLTWSSSTRTSPWFRPTSAVSRSTAAAKPELRRTSIVRAPSNPAEDVVMRLSTGTFCPLTAAGLAAVLTVGCGDIIIGADLGKYVEREEKHFPTSGKADVTLATFDGSIEVRPWDKPEVQVIIEKRARDKAAVDEIDIRSEQNGDHIVVEVKARKNDHRGMNLGWNLPRAAKRLVSVPASADLSARSGDGSIDVERIVGRVEMHSGDGSIRARDVGGDVTAPNGARTTRSTSC